MQLRSLSVADASAIAVQTLGLQQDLVGLDSAEGIAATIRRAASFMCPTTPARIVDAVLDVIQPVATDEIITRESIANILELMISGGDLLEFKEDAERLVRLLYLGPPSFIEIEPGIYLLIGVRPHAAALIDPDLSEAVDREGHTQILRWDQSTAVERLTQAGLQAIDRRRWVGSPSSEAPEALIARTMERLDAARHSGEIDDLLILDPQSEVTFYPKRWRAPRDGDTGDFIARRPQAYGADLWCVVRLDAGRPQKLVDLPIDDAMLPGRDEAWRIQMAIDALQRQPQQYEVRGIVGADASLVSFFSPIPGFAERYLQLVGIPVPNSRGCLFSFRVPDGAIRDLERVLMELLWLDPKESKQ